MTTNSRWRSNAQFKLTRNSELHTDVPAAGVDVRRRYQCGDALHQRHSLDQRWHCSQVVGILSADLVQTKADSVASIKAPSTSVLVSSDSLVQFQGDAVKLEHGGMNVGTSKSGLPAPAGLELFRVPLPGPNPRFVTSTVRSKLSPAMVISLSSTPTVPRRCPRVRRPHATKPRKRARRNVIAVRALCRLPVTVSLTFPSRSVRVLWVGSPPGFYSEAMNSSARTILGSGSHRQRTRLCPRDKAKPGTNPFMRNHSNLRLSLHACIP